MASGFGGPAKVALVMIAAFVAVAGILLALLPGPLKNTDYLVIGTLGTFAALDLLFLLVIRPRGPSG